MGAAAAVVAGQIITSIVVSKVATVVAQKIGLSDDLAGLVGIGAGLYAGGLAGAEMTAASTATAPAGVDIAASALPPANIPGTPIAPSAAPPVTTGPGMIPGPIQGVQSPLPAPPNIQSGGMLAPKQTPPVASATAPPVGTDTATDMVKAGTTSVPADPGATSWWDRIWQSSKTMDTLVGAAGGAAQGYLQGQAVKDQYKAQYAREDELAGRWGDGSLNGSLAYPNQARSGMLTRGMA